MKDKNANTEEVLRKTLAAKGNLDKSVRDDILVKVRAQDALNQESSRISLKWGFILVGVLVAIVAVSVVTIYPALNNRDKPVGEGQDFTIAKGELLEDLNSGDIERLQKVFAGGDVMHYSGGIIEEISFDSLLLIISSYEEFNLATEEEIALVVSLGAPMEDYSDTYVSNDGGLFIIVNEVGGRYSVTIFSLIEADVSDYILSESEEEPIEETEDQKVVEDEISRSVEIRGAPFYTDTIFYREEGGTILVHFAIAVEGLNENDSCKQVVNTYGGSTLVDSYSEEIAMNNEHFWPNSYSVTAQIGIGRSVITAECEELSKAFTVTVVEVPGSVCDDVTLVAVLSDITLEEARTQITGSWVGCSFNPWSSPYRVRFDFFDDGRFGAYNMEIEVDENTLRSHEALFYGIDGEHDKKAFELADILPDGSIEGELYFLNTIEFLDKGEIMNLGFSEDRSSMYFEVVRGGAEPLKYMLERQVP